MASERAIRIIYVTETGTARDVGEFIGREAGRYALTASVEDVAGVEPASLATDSRVTVWVVATTGQGEMPTRIRPLWRLLLRKSLPRNALAGHSFAVFALGDSGYRLYNAAGRKLFKRLSQLGAYPVIPRGEGDDQHPHGLDGALHPWLDLLWEHLLLRHPLPPGHTVLTRQELGCPPPRYQLELLPRDAPCASPTERDAVRGAALRIADLGSAKVVSNARLTALDHWQDVRHIELALDPPAAYVPGDVINILPSNTPAMVDAFAELLNLDLDAVVSIEAAPDAPPASTPLAGLVVSLRDLFTHVIDITASPRRYFFELAPWLASDDREVERLTEFASPGGQDELYDYNYRDARWPVEVFTDFPSLRPPLHYLLDMLPLIQPRAYSISSPPDASPATTASITLAVVSYTTKIKTPRHGLASACLAQAEQGARLPVFVSRGAISLPPPQLPMVLVGPGTGIAPFMAFLAARADAHAAAGTTPDLPDMLFFGNRDPAADNLYSAQLAAWEAAGYITVFYAWSRPVSGVPKAYVQDRMREPEPAAALWHLLSSAAGVVYICGSAKKMPGAVKDALVDVATSAGGLARPDAEAWLKSLVKSRRLLEDTWM
ncbi:NADPH-dependent diflavin oxidoreductase 1 [Thecamonas trahens ATCC 50062]|uniref:NADPH-dependent diflavin oxidoreductase 1 n=1 Tax=Thecamonas trahens ATCC 50062 TaxID=461836 RepID=A0A0L0D6Y8_THETB|nr:NADPH-dependent diflavin oxidoreductase 1 [Thecamonas trahens ATCC 50062]KNC47866.1 NADPH-dependent diflavin oxidoreductase 1 [Thecamonas trahens ATCC 50062]|eukprot:XP_013759344.1 NADPH-dependent diflavin oxidoreductase 1 [Thecamonas trahens ATCC 50062]